MFKFHNFSLTAWLWLWIMFAAGSARAQQTLTWEQVRARFEQSNPTLLANKLSVDESRAQEITVSCARIRRSCCRRMGRKSLLRKASGDRSPGRLSHPALAICMSDSTSGSCASRVRKRQL